MKLQLTIATILVACGMLLLFLGFWVPPEGQIHESVLVAFGETMTFAGALFGVDYRYRYLVHKIFRHHRGEDDSETECDETNKSEQP